MSNNFVGKKQLSNHPIPVYYQLQNELKSYIEDGKWAPGEPIPSSRNIAETYNVSMGTVQKAIANLVKEKYLFCVQGKGTFVATTDIKQESLRYTLLRQHFDGDDLSFKVKLIGTERVDGFRPVNRYLKLGKHEELFCVKRVFVSRSGPIVYTISYLPCNMFENFEDKVAKLLGKITLYEVIEQKYGLPTVRNKELFSIAVADEEIAGILEIRIGTPILSTEMLSYTYKEQPYEYRVTYWETGKRKLFREII
ncbi:MAG: GntR family transcriptional regulator [Deltaproteobacteria bacterium]|nr:GntR family transcriptional regulator [Deltaproteobacteria bacterium]